MPKNDLAALQRVLAKLAEAQADLVYRHDGKPLETHVRSAMRSTTVATRQLRSLLGQLAKRK